MTVILMLVMFADLPHHRLSEKAQRSATHGRRKRRIGDTFAAACCHSFVAGFELPDNRRYHLGHTWALQGSPTLGSRGNR